MRRWTLVPIIAGLLLSMFPTLLMAQSATPVVEPTPTEVVASPSPEIADTQSPVQQDDTDAQPAATGLDATAPFLTLNGSTTDITVAVGALVTILTDQGAGIWVYEDSACEVGGHFPWNTPLTTVSSNEDSLSFQAFWYNNAGAPGSDCLTATWEHQAPAVAPSLIITDMYGIEHTASGGTVPVSANVRVTTDPSAVIYRWPGNVCEGPGIPTGTVSEITIGLAHESSLAFQASWTSADAGPASDCVVMRWSGYEPVQAPSLTIDSEPIGKTVPVGTSVQLNTQASAAIFEHSTQDCAGSGIRIGSPPATVSAPSTVTRYYQSVWENYPNAEPSPCLAVTWEEPGPAIAPSLTIDNGTTGKTVTLGTFVTAFTESGAHILSYEDANCTLNEVASVVPESSAVWHINHTGSFRAAWDGYPNAPKSDCLSVTWQNPVPTVAPVLTLDNVASSKTVAIGESVDVETDQYAELLVYFGATDCDGFGPSLNNSEYTDSSDTPTSNSYRSVWTGFPNAPKSDCFTITWEDPAPTVAPALTLDDIASSKTAQIGDFVVVSTDPFAQLYLYFGAANCDGPSELIAGSQYIDGSDQATPNSYRSVWTGFPNAPQSDCLTINWEDPAPTVAPRLTLDGVADNITLDVGRSVEISTETYAELYVFTGATACEGTGTPVNDSHFNDASNSPTSHSYQSMWTGYPNAPRSECLTATWQLPAPTVAPSLTLDDEVESVTVPLGTDLYVATEPGATIWRFTDASCTQGADDSLSSGFSEGSEVEMTIAYQARWTGFPDAPASECLTATWQVPAPTVAPPLTLDGGDESVAVPLGTDLFVATEPGATIWEFSDASCTDGAYNSHSPGYTVSSEAEVTASYQARWTGFPDAPASECLTSTWVARPILKLNGTGGDAIVDVGEEIILMAANDAHLEIFAAEGCTGTSEIFGAEHAVTQDLPVTMYVRAISNIDDTFASDCFEATWTKSTTVRVQMWDESSLEGSAWSLYAPTASQVAGGAYLTGVLDQSNTASFTDLAAGEYQFVVEPAGQDSLEFTITISNASESLAVQVAQPQDPVTPAPTPVPATEEPTTTPSTPVPPTEEPTTTPTTPVPPTEEPTTTPSTPVPATPGATNAPTDPAPTAAAVTGLPETGTGSGNSAVVIGLAGLLAAALLLMIGSRRTSHR